MPQGCCQRRPQVGGANPHIVDHSESRNVIRDDIANDNRYIGPICDLVELRLLDPFWGPSLGVFALVRNLPDLGAIRQPNLLDHVGTELSFRHLRDFVYRESPR